MVGWTKKQFAEKAFEKIGLSAYVYQLEPDQILGAVQDMDSMVAGWVQLGIDIAYPLNNTPTPDIDQHTGVPIAANLAIYMNLAKLIASGFGKVLSPVNLALADTSFGALLNWAARPVPQMCLPGRMPIGAGNKYWNDVSYPFFGPYQLTGYRNGYGTYQAFGPTPFVTGD